MGKASINGTALRKNGCQGHSSSTSTWAQWTSQRCTQAKSTKFSIVLYVIPSRCIQSQYAEHYRSNMVLLKLRLGQWETPNSRVPLEKTLNHIARLTAVVYLCMVLGARSQTPHMEWKNESRSGTVLGEAWARFDEARCDQGSGTVHGATIPVYFSRYPPGRHPSPSFFLFPKVEYAMDPEKKSPTAVS